jgi:hypothetical protein
MAINPNLILEKGYAHLLIVSFNQYFFRISYILYINNTIIKYCFNFVIRKF